MRKLLIIFIFRIKCLLWKIKQLTLFFSSHNQSGHCTSDMLKNELNLLFLKFRDRLRKLQHIFNIMEKRWEKMEKKKIRKTKWGKNKMKQSFCIYQFYVWVTKLCNFFINNLYSTVKIDLINFWDIFTHSSTGVGFFHVVVFTEKPEGSLDISGPIASPEHLLFLGG